MEIAHQNRLECVGPKKLRLLGVFRFGYPRQMRRRCSRYRFAIAKGRSLSASRILWEKAYPPQMVFLVPPCGGADRGGLHTLRLRRPDWPSCPNRESTSLLLRSLQDRVAQ